MLDIDIIHRSYFNCYADNRASILHFYKKEYMYIFANNWRVLPWIPGFDGSKLVDNPPQNNLLLLDRYCGARPDTKTFGNYKDFKAYAIEILNSRRPIMVLVDMFDLPWSEYYNITHTKHVIMLIGYKKDDIFQACDPTKQMNHLELNMQRAFQNQITTEVLANDLKAINLNENDIIAESKRILSQDISINKGYERLLDLATKFIKDENKMFSGSRGQFESESFLTHLLFLGRGRIGFAEFLEYLNKKNGTSRYDFIIQRLKELGAKWQTLRMKVIKIRVRNDWNNKLEELSKQLIELINEDKQLCEEFICTENSEGQALEDCLDLSQLMPHEICINNAFNSNAFNSEVWENSTGFDSNGYFYKMSIEEMYYDEAFCKLRLYINQELDNISCNKQEISINIENVKTIMLIGSAERGNYSEKIIVQYDNDQETMSLNFSDWWERDSLFGEKIVLGTKCCKVENGQTIDKGEVYILSQLIRVKKGNNSMLRSIILPECANIHIFGMIVYN